MEFPCILSIAKIEFRGVIPILSVPTRASSPLDLFVVHWNIFHV
jgi:hypothetical protein